MPKQKRTLSPEHLEKLKAGREAKKLAEEVERVRAEVGQEGDNPPQAPTREPAQTVPKMGGTNVVLTQEQFQEMINRISSQAPQPQTGTPQMNESGQPIGVTEKHSINPNDYRNPVETLYDLPKLRRYSMRENFIIRWSVTPTRYQTAFGTWFVEPRFELTLLRKRFDEETGEERADKIVVGRASFFEDLPANLLEAEGAGLTLEDVGTQDFSEKMKMYRYQMWLVEQLQPSRPKTTGSRKKLEVIGGTAYEIEEGNSVV